MFTVEVTQNLLESQLKSVKSQLLDVGIRVTCKMANGKVKWLGYVATITGTGPFKVQIRMNEDVKFPTDRPHKGFKFVLEAGRFVLSKNK